MPNQTVLDDDARSWLVEQLKHDIDVQNALKQMIFDKLTGRSGRARRLARRRELYRLRKQRLAGHS
jgi:hypothetical protein